MPAVCRMVKRLRSIFLVALTGLVSFLIAYPMARADRGDSSRVQPSVPPVSIAVYPDDLGAVFTRAFGAIGATRGGFQPFPMLLKMQLRAMLGFDPTDRTSMSGVGIGTERPLRLQILAPDWKQIDAYHAYIRRGAGAGFAPPHSRSGLGGAGAQRPFAQLRRFAEAAPTSVVRIAVELPLANVDRFVAFAARTWAKRPSKSVWLDDPTLGNQAAAIASTFSLSADSAERLFRALRRERIVLLRSIDRNLAMTLQLADKHALLTLFVGWGQSSSGLEERSLDAFLAEMRKKMPLAGREASRSEGRTMLAASFSADGFSRLMTLWGEWSLIERHLFRAPKKGKPRPDLAAELRSYRGCAAAWRRASMDADVRIVLGVAADSWNARATWRLADDVTRTLESQIISSDLVDLRCQTYQGCGSIRLNLSGVANAFQSGVFGGGGEAFNKRLQRCTLPASASLLHGGWIGLPALLRSELRSDVALRGLADRVRNAAVVWLRSKVSAQAGKEQGANAPGLPVAVGAGVDLGFRQVASALRRFARRSVGKGAGATAMKEGVLTLSRSCIRPCRGEGRGRNRKRARGSRRAR